MNTEVAEPSPKAALAGKIVVNVLIVGLLTLVAAGVLINNKIESRILQLANPAVGVVGLGQYWAVFAPPRKGTNYVDARIRYADGSTSIWRVPNHLGFWDHKDYHWTVLGNYIRDKKHAEVWEPFARYVADRDRTLDREPVSVSLSVEWAKNRPPGESSPQGPWRTKTFYTLDLSGDSTKPENDRDRQDSAEPSGAGSATGEDSLSGSISDEDHGTGGVEHP